MTRASVNFAAALIVGVVLAAGILVLAALGAITAWALWAR